MTDIEPTLYPINDSGAPWEAVVTLDNERNGTHYARLLPNIAGLLGVILLLAATREYSYLLFHSLAELFSIFIAFTLLMLVWNTRRIQGSDFLNIIGIGYAAAACIDLVHTLAYKGMNIFPGYGANLATQLWISARYLQVLGLFAASVAFGKKRRLSLIMAAFGGLTLLLVLASFTGYFPECYREGEGLTPFKITSEYLIITIIMVSTYLLHRMRASFHETTYRLIMASFLCTICAELCFTAYIDVYDVANMAGHCCKLAAYYLIYRAIFVTGIRDPFSTLFRELKQSERSLIESRDSVKRQVEQRTAELAASEERYRVLYNNAADAIFIHDMAAHIVSVNEQATRQYGYSREAFLKLMVNDIDTPEDTVRIMERIAALDRDGCAAFESVHRHATGRLIPVDVKAAQIWVDGESCVMSICRDITERKRAEKDLKASLAFNRQMISCAQEGIIVHDRELRYQAWNPFMEKITGVPAADVVGKHPLDRFPFTRETGALEQLEKVLAGETVPGAEFFFTVPETGKSGWTYNTAAPLRTESGEIFGIIRTLSDMTGHRKLEDQLRQSQKMEALGQLAGGVAHDFNNMLQVIMGYAMLVDMGATPEQKEPLQEILGASERAAELTRGLLSYSRKQVFKLERVDINRLVADVEKFLRRILGEDIALSLEPASVPLVARVDKSHIQQVFVNLASNARDAMAVGGRLSIHLEQMDMDDEFVSAHGFGKVGRYALISVSDTGLGISADHLHKIFDPFFTTKEEGKGTGLGLAIVYGIIYQHGGFITCYSEEGVGTIFQIYLPLVDMAADIPKPHADTENIAVGQLTILLVEDDPAVRKVTRNMLEVHGHTVIEATHGMAALEIFRQKQSDIHLVILDVLLPQMNGAETLQALQEIAPDVKALFVSGYAREIISGKMAIPEHIAFLNKPVIPARLMEAIGKAISNSPHS